MTNPPPGYPPQPPYGGQQPSDHPPPYSPPPPPAPLVARIPQDQPFVVRPNLTKRALLSGGIALLITTPIAACGGVGILDAAGPDQRANAALGILAGLGCLLAVVALPIGIQLWLIGSRGPVLALSPAGLWIRTRPTRGQAIWLPWEAIAQISRRRWSLEKMLVVKPHDPRVLPQLGTYTALDSAPLNALYGSGLVATLNFADKSEAEILAAVAHFSANRCRLS
ncbi:hypothetical protein [Micromonospora sp. DT229]|uniref:hypothetical protein n=1 Tax=Micromonospora sp. DT229 TaxID=3393430 RepID=UPI003CF9C62B